MLAAGFSMLVSALQVYFRDLKSFLPYLLRVWLYVSPVLYYADEMPAQYQFLLDVNPIGQLLDGVERGAQRGPARRGRTRCRRRRLGVRRLRRRLPVLRLAGA